MKLTYFQLEQHLAKQLSPVYLITGDELVLKNEAIQSIRKSAKKAGITERVRLAPSAGFDWEELHNTLYATSLLAEKRLIELDFRDGSPNKTASSILKEYALAPVSDNVLLLDFSKIDDKTAKNAWFSALEKIGVWITIWPIPREQLPQWIHQRAKKYKLQFSPDGADVLADYVEGNLVAAADAIEKIYLLRPEKIIDGELVQSILADESHFTVFDFVENSVAGNLSRAIHILTSLKSEGIEPTLILWAITRELRLLADMATALKEGSAYESLFQKHRVFARRQQAVRQFLKKFNAENCWQFLTQATQIDYIIKGAKLGDVWDQLQLLCLRMNA